jgi:aspartyl-tRNA(Asn)/glutamyl-tRNA(Gln) amidotransferase subunit A
MKPHGSLLPRLTIRQVNRLLADDVISVQDLCRYCYALAVSGEQVWKLNAFARLVSLDEIMEKARQSDDRRNKKRRGDTLMLSPLLDGIPFSVKANLAIASQKLTAGSRILGATASREEDHEDTSTAGYTADVVRDLESSGAIFMGVTNMDEFGMGSLGTHQPGAATGGTSTTTTKNPLPFLHAMQQTQLTTLSLITTGNEMDLIKRTLQSSMAEILEMHEEVIATSQAQQTEYYSAGGSSCGSAASVAHGSSFVSLGSDTGGSVRLPASWCGIVGLKPSYGRLSRHGLVSYASSLDTVGLLAPSADCAALAFQQLVQPYTTVTTSSSTNKEEGRAGLDNNTQQQRRRIGDSTHSLRQAEFLVRTGILHDDSNNDNKSSKNEILKGLRVGLPEAFAVEECPIAIQKAWSQSAHVLHSHGATVEIVPAHVISSTVLKSLLAAYYVLVCAEASSNLARYDGFRYGVGASAAEIDSILYEYCRAKGEGTKRTIDGNDDSNNNKLVTDLSLLEWQYAAARTRGFGPEVQRRILCGTAVLSSDRFHTYYEAAAKLRAVATQQLHSCLRQQFRHGDKREGNSNNGGGQDPQRHYFDMLLVPTTLYPPPHLGGDSEGSSDSKIMDSAEMFANDIMTVPASLAGLPAVSVPFGDCILLNEDASNSQSSSRNPAPASCYFRPGMQLIGARQQEDRILQVAAVLEMQRRTIYSSNSVLKKDSTNIE